MDIKVLWNNDISEGDIGFQDNDLILEYGLESAVMLSLFIDQRAEDDDLLDDPEDKRGWWGDKLETDGDKIGSKLWLMERASTTQRNIAKIKEYIYDCLEWLITDGICSDIKVEVERIKNDNGDRLYCLIQIVKRKEQTIAMQFDNLWNGQFNIL